MSSYERRVNSTGTESHRIRFRCAGKNEAVTFATEPAARSFQAIVDSLGGERALELARTTTLAPPTATRRTVAAQVEHHIEHLTGIEDGTRRKHRKNADLRINDYFGDILLGDLTRDHVAAWVNKMERTPSDFTGERLAPKTIKNTHSLLSEALSSAVRDGLIPANVAKGVKLRKRDATTEEHVYLTHAEFATLLPMIPAHYRPITVFLVGTGVRFGEASAIRVRDLNLTDSSARVRQAWKDTSGNGYRLGAPKTSKSLRTIGLPPGVVKMLQLLIADKRPDDYVFVNTRGNPIRNGVFHESAWQRLMHEKDGTDGPFVIATGKRPRVHDLRHTYASWAISAGIPLPVIQRQLGHESITTTVDDYGHLVRSDLDALALTIGRGLPELGA